MVDSPHNKMMKDRRLGPATTVAQQSRRAPGAAGQFLPTRVAQDIIRQVGEARSSRESMALEVPYESEDRLHKDGPRAQRAAYDRAGGGQYQRLDGPPGANMQPTTAVHQPSGSVVTDSLQHPSFNTLERLYRTLPDPAFFNPGLSPQRPFTFQLGAYTVPQGQQLWLTDYQFAVLRQFGLDPGDFIAAEQGRFQGQLGFDVTINGKRPNNISYELDPKPLTDVRPEFRQFEQNVFADGRVIATNSDFDEASAQQFGASGGQGTSLLPVRSQLQGARSGPFTMIVEENQVVALSVTLFRPLRTPIAGIQGRLAGFLLHTNLAKALLNRIYPR